MTSFITELAETMTPHGFHRVESNLALVMKRQNFNTNRAMAVITLDIIPPEFGNFVREMRRVVAKQCGYIPILWVIGIQLVVVAPGFSASAIDPKNYLAPIDEQWAIVQSLFLVDTQTNEYRGARTWGQFITGKFRH